MSAFSQQQWPYGYSLNPLTAGPETYRTDAKDVMASAFSWNWSSILFRAREMNSSYVPAHVKNTYGSIETFRDDQMGKEAGCGLLGCVYRTFSPKVVFKITSDVFEAAFVKALLELEKHGVAQPQGLVQYKAIYQLRGDFPISASGSTNLYALWREAAFDIGDPAWSRRAESEGFSVKQTLLAESALEALTDVGTDIRLLLEKARGGSNFSEWLQQQFEELSGLPEDIAAPQHEHDFGAAFPLTAELARYNYAVLRLRASGVGSLAADALRELMRLGIVLPDLHADNVGHAKRDNKAQLGKIVITDPSFCLFLSSSYWDALEKIKTI